MSNIYTSTNLAEGQLCDFNAGNPKLGECHIRIVHEDIGTLPPTHGYNHQDLKFKYEYVGDEDINYGKFNFGEILYTNLLAPNNPQVNQRMYDARENMYHNKEGYIQIPATGFYRIHLSGSTELLDKGEYTEDRWIRDPEDWGLGKLGAPFKYNIVDRRNIYSTCPIEIQFVKSCLENLYQCKYDKITHLLRDGSSLIFCTYIDGKIVFAENIQVAGFKRMEQNVVYSLKELGISGSL